MLISFLVVLDLLTPRCASASPSYPELDPALGKYQDVASCLPLRLTLYSVYRNFETDPVLGGTAKCGRFSIPSPAVNGTYIMLAQYGETSDQIALTASRSEGYNVDNVLHYTPIGQNVSSTVYVAYEGCEDCAIYRNTYVSEAACTLLVPESALAKNRTCCDFVFDLLCGTTPKYYTYDETCEN
ncbi:uncharacterized protein ISCGN_012013 [Ixodes scapularis]